MDVLFSQLEKYFFPIRENDFSNWEKRNRGMNDHLCTKLFYEEWSSNFIWRIFDLKTSNVNSGNDRSAEYIRGVTEYVKRHVKSK